MTRLAPVFLLFAGCLGPTVTGSGTPATEDRPFAGCRGVRASGQTNVVVTRGATPALSVTWDDNLVGLVETEVRDGLLEVSVRSSRYSATTPLTVAVTVPELQSAQASGQAVVVAEVGGVSHFTAIASGQARLTLRGTAERQDVDASGQSHIDAHELLGRTATVTASGQARIGLGVTGKVQAIASGQSLVEHAAAETDAHASGQATVRGR